MMTSELEDRYTDLRFSPYGTAFLTDAIIVQRYIEVDSRLLRVMAVVKVRAQAHSDAVRLFSIDNDGIHVGETLPDMEGLLVGRPMRKRSGLSLSLPMLSTETAPRALPDDSPVLAPAAPAPAPAPPIPSDKPDGA